MLQRLTYPGIELPKLYIAENSADVATAKRAGIPFVKWSQGKEELLRQLLRPALEKMFPGIDWNKVLGKRKLLRSKVLFGAGTEDRAGGVSQFDKEAMLKAQMEGASGVKESDRYTNEDGESERIVGIADDYRCCASESAGSYGFLADPISIADYVGDLSSSVDLDALQELGMMPAFIGDIQDCVRRNLSNRVRWTEGYNKKLAECIGKFDRSSELPNLLIIDVSRSIPDGIAATMLTLADTLRETCDAELIITSRRSGYYGPNDKLPTPDTLRSYYGRSNESAEFMGILEKHIAGRKFGHVISFGDNDNPGNLIVDMAGTDVQAIHHYHTWRTGIATGYARWAEEVSPNAAVTHSTDWCDFANKKYKMIGGW